MRVALNAWFWNRPETGSGQYTRRLAEGLVALQADLQIVLIIPTDKGRVTGREKQVGAHPSGCVQHGCVQHSCPEDDPPQHPAGLLYPVPCPRSRLGKVRFEQILFPHACVRLGADVAHVPYWAPPLVHSTPTVVTIHDLIPLLLSEYRGGPLVRLYTMLVSTSARSAAQVLTDSRASRRDILAHLGLPSERVKVIYLAAGERYTRTPPPSTEEKCGGAPLGLRATRLRATRSPNGEDAVRARYRLPERYVLYLGGFDVRKNVATAIGTYRWAGPAIGEECPLVIAGRLPERDTPFTPDPHRLAREQGIDERFMRFTGFVDEAHKPALYRGAVAFIFPSLYEGFGLPPLEALACGTPVVGSAVSSIPEVVGDAGVLLPPDDAEGMARALIQLATNANFHAELSHRALVQASHFSWKRVARETWAAYQETAG
jgi:glycosyltransferase involved in cell wall biosynthesis